MIVNLRFETEKVALEHIYFEALDTKLSLIIPHSNVSIHLSSSVGKMGPSVAAVPRVSVSLRLKNKKSTTPRI